MAKILTNKLLKNTLLPIFLIATISGCAQGKTDPFDRQTGTTREEVKDVFFGNKAKTEAAKKSSSNAPSNSVAIPQISRMVSIPSLPKTNNEKLISFSVTDQVPLKDVIIELAKVAKLDIDLDPSIDGGVIVNAKNRPLTEILDRICDMGSLRYTLENNVLHVERDLPFAKNYLVDFLINGNLWGGVETNVVSLIADTGAGAKSSAGGSVSSNKLANTMTIFASQKNHIRVKNYLDSVRKHSSAQVLIEAKVVEVALSDTYKTGIDWTFTQKGETSAAPLLKQSGGGNSGSIAGAITLLMPKGNLFGSSLNTTISALETFGVVKTISSPRVSALNNQKSYLNFTHKLPYFIYSATQTDAVTSATGTTPAKITITSTLNTELTGVDLNITPTIDLVSGEITLDVQPKITSSSTNASSDVQLSDKDGKLFIVATNKIPIVDTRELKTIAKIQSGSVLVIGGVMSESTTNEDSGIPFLQSIPILGYLFKSTSKVSKVIETAIFIKATIIGTGDGVNKYDRKLNDTFTSSDRPFFNSN